MIQHSTEQLKKKDRAKIAVNMAMEGKWDEAALVNKEILEESPDNVEALSRLGKALSEVGRYTEARASFRRVLELAPMNAIAKKNLERIALLKDEQAPKTLHQAAHPNFFIEETGKTGVTALIDVAAATTVAKLVAGESVRLEPQEHKLLARNSQGEYVGTVEPKLGLRLLRLVRSGNRYAAAIASVSEQQVRLIIKETYQHPSQNGRLSFPPKGQDNFKGYAWEGSNRLVADDGDAPTLDSGDEPSDDEGSNLDDVSSYKKRSRSRRAIDPDGEEEES